MEDWRNVLVSPYTKIHETIKIIDLNSLQIALVVDERNKLLGTVTDGDVRRGLLKGISIDDTVEKIMNRNPITIPEMKDKNSIINILKINKLRHLPVVDNEGCVIGIERLDDFFSCKRLDNWVIIMAGGLGSRLKPLTNNCPKPMLSIEEKPLLEIILKQFIEQGFYRFCFSINYKGEQIKNYFGDGLKWGGEIHYIDEQIRMGTAGCLSLFTNKTDKPIVVMNGDVLTKVNFEQLINFHIEQQVSATIAVRKYDIQIPYGVVRVDNNRLIGFDEKPIYSNFINAGVYVIDSNVLDKIPKNSYFDMSQLFNDMLIKNDEIAVFPIREYWIDIGKIEDYYQAKLDFNEVFQ